MGFGGDDLPAADGTSALEQWYRSVQDQPIADLSDRDLCRAVRQDVHLQFVVPIAIERVASNPLLGELYDGEMLNALAGLPAEWWSHFRGKAFELRRAIDRAASELEQDLRTPVLALRDLLAD
jgi:hypothetical protein